MLENGMSRILLLANRKTVKIEPYVIIWIIITSITHFRWSQCNSSTCTFRIGNTIKYLLCSYIIYNNSTYAMYEWIDPSKAI
jgi:low affinity Fe/Cu permease